jgi:uncharacterized UBP type Zn finger protein
VQEERPAGSWCGGLVNQRNSCYANALLQLLARLRFGTEVVAQLDDANLELPKPNLGQHQTAARQFVREFVNVVNYAAHSDAANVNDINDIHNNALGVMDAKPIHTLLVSLRPNPARASRRAAMNDEGFANAAHFLGETRQDSHEFLFLVLAVFKLAFSRGHGLPSNVPTAAFETNIVEAVCCNNCKISTIRSDQIISDVQIHLPAPRRGARKGRPGPSTPPLDLAAEVDKVLFLKETRSAS